MTKVIAIVVWLVLVAFLTVTLWPSEVSSIKALWNSASPVADGFGGGLADMTEAPLWLLIALMSLIAMVYTVPGLTFIFSKGKVAHLHDMWRLRREALQLIAEANDTDGTSDEGRNATDIADHFDSDAVRINTAKAIVLNAIHAYEKAVHGRQESANNQLIGANALSTKERNECLSITKKGDILIAATAQLIV